MEVYSSPTEDMISSAPVRMLATAREICGWAMVAPAALGNPASRPAALVPIADGSAPTARSSPGAVEPSVPSSATSRWAGSTIAFPALVAPASAAAMTSRLLVVRISVFIGACGTFRRLVYSADAGALRLLGGRIAVMLGVMGRACSSSMQRRRVEPIPLKFATAGGRRPRRARTGLGPISD